MTTPEGMPDWIANMEDDDEQDVSMFRAKAEWCWFNMLDQQTRDQVRLIGINQTQYLIEAGYEDPTDLVTADRLWKAWYMSSVNWQMFITSDCGMDEGEQAHLTMHAVRALQWSAVLLLIVTEPDLPDPPQEQL